MLQAVVDADTMIVHAAINQCTESAPSNVVIVGEDADLFVLLVAHMPISSDILLLKPGSSERAKKIYSSTQLQFALGTICRQILFAHVASGCDSTKVNKLLENDRSLCDTISIFNYQHTLPDEIASAGERFILLLYGAPKDTSTLNQLSILITKKQQNKASVITSIFNNFHQHQMLQDNIHSASSIKFSCRVEQSYRRRSGAGKSK